MDMQKEVKRRISADWGTTSLEKAWKRFTYIRGGKGEKKYGVSELGTGPWKKKSLGGGMSGMKRS